MPLALWFGKQVVVFDDQDLHLISFPEGFTAITSRVFYTNRAFLRAGQIPIHSVGFPTYRKPLCVFTLITRNAATHAIEESVNGGATQQNGLPRRSFVIILHRNHHYHRHLHKATYHSWSMSLSLSWLLWCKHCVAALLAHWSANHAATKLQCTEL